MKHSKQTVYTKYNTYSMPHLCKSGKWATLTIRNPIYWLFIDLLLLSPWNLNTCWIERQALWSHIYMHLLRLEAEYHFSVLFFLSFLFGVTSLENEIDSWENFSNRRNQALCICLLLVTPAHSRPVLGTVVTLPIILLFASCVPTALFMLKLINTHSAQLTRR